MKRSSGAGNAASPAQKHHRAEINPMQKNEWKRIYKQVDTSGNVVWSGTVEIPDSQNKVFDCSIKACRQVEGILSSKQLTLGILPSSAWISVLPHGRRLPVILFQNETTDADRMLYSAIRFDMKKVHCAVLKNTAYALYLLYVHSFSSGHKDYIIGNIGKYQANDTLLGILRSHALLPCANPEHVLEQEHAELKEDIQRKDSMLKEKEIELTRMKKELEKIKKEIVKKDEVPKESQHKVDERCKGALWMPSHSDAWREGRHTCNINQSSTEGNNEQILIMEASLCELEYKVTMMQAALDENRNMIEDELKCSICSELFIKTVTLNCSHSFCAYCIQKWQKKGTCPICRTKITVSVRCKVLDSFIERFIDKSGDEAKERERVMEQQEGQLCSISEYSRQSDDETSTSSSSSSSLAYLSPSATFRSPDHTHVHAS